MQLHTKLNYHTNISWLHFIGVLFFLLICLPMIIGIFIALPFWLYEQANPNTNKLLLESISNSSYDLVSLLLLILYIMKYKPMRALVLPAINFQVLKSFRMYIYVLIYYAISLLADMFILDELFPLAVQEQSDALELSTLEHYPLLLILSSGILAPIFEELICRGIFLRFLKKSLLFGQLQFSPVYFSVLPIHIL